MQWLTDLLAHVGPHGAFSNASRSLADEREVADGVERFLLRFDHPAGRSRAPAEPSASECSQVA